jgi:hypothetical protein
VLVAQGLSRWVILWREMAVPLQTPLAGPSPCLILALQGRLLRCLNPVEHVGFLVIGIFL